jgi:phosphate transport system substrate-binding protein
MEQLSLQPLFIAFIFICSSVVAPNVASAETVRINGSAGLVEQLLVLHQHEIEQKTGHRLQIEPSRADVGLLALFDGKADLAIVAASPDDVIALLKEIKPELPYGRLRSFLVSETRVAYAVNPHNPIRSITRAKLRQVLTGQIDNWRELGGPDLPIRVVSLSGAGGARLTTQDVILGGIPIAARSETRVAIPEDVTKVVAEDLSALGIAQAALVNRSRLPELRMEGPIRQQFYLVSLGEPVEAARSVVTMIRSLSFEENP